MTVGFGAKSEANDVWVERPLSARKRSSHYAWLYGEDAPKAVIRRSNNLDGGVKPMQPMPPQRPMSGSGLESRRWRPPQRERTFKRLALSAFWWDDLTADFAARIGLGMDVEVPLAGGKLLRLLGRERRLPFDRVFRGAALLAHPHY